MKIIIVTRDVKFGVGATVKNIVWQLEHRDDIEKIVVICPEKFDVKSDKVQFEIVPLVGKLFATKEPFFALQAAKRISSLFKNDTYDVIHLHCNVLPFSRTKNTKIIATFHSTHWGAFHIPAQGFIGYLGKIIHLLYRPFDYIRARLSDQITYVSHETGKELRRYYMNTSKTFAFIPNGVDTSMYKPLPDKTREPLNKLFPEVDFANKIVLFHIGRLEPGKGFETLFEAIKQDERYVAVLVGEGYLKHVFEKIERVYCAGFISDIALKNELFNASDIMVLPSYYENFNSVLCEAMGAGIPAIVSNVGMNSYLVGGDHNLLFTPGNPKELKERLDYIVSHEAYFHEISERNREFAISQLDWKNIISTYLTLYSV